MGKGEIAQNEQFLLFPQCFLPFWRIFCHFRQIRHCRLQTLPVWKSLTFDVWERDSSTPIPPLQTISKEFWKLVKWHWKTFRRHKWMTDINGESAAQDWTVCIRKVILIYTIGVNPLPHNSEFYQPRGRILLKTLWEKEKMLVTSIFSFFPQYFLLIPYSLFYTYFYSFLTTFLFFFIYTFILSPARTIIIIIYLFIYLFILSSANSFNFDWYKNLSFGS